MLQKNLAVEEVKLQVRFMKEKSNIVSHSFLSKVPVDVRLQVQAQVHESLSTKNLIKVNYITCTRGSVF